MSLGSNLGDRYGYLRQAIEKLNAHPEIRVVQESSVYETDPVGFEDQPIFLNSAIAVETSLLPRDLLQVTCGIESDLGRVRTFRWGPRVIDIDILYYEGANEESQELTIPHPRIPDRAFVLAPFAEIAPDLELPDGRRVEAIFAALPEEETAKVRKWEPG